MKTSSTATSEEKMLDFFEEYPFEYQFSQENDNLVESKLLNNNENYVSGHQLDSNLKTFHESSLVVQSKHTSHCQLVEKGAKINQKVWLCESWTISTCSWTSFRP